jgi:small subunit ribosomal protein S6
MPGLVASSEDTRVYELCLLYPYPFNQKEEQELLKEVEGMFEEAGAKLITKDAWGHRGLAYPIGGLTEGHFIIYYWELDPSKIKELDQQLRILKGVLRHLFVKPPKHYQIVKFSAAYEQWLKDRETQEEVKAREREQKVQEQVARKAKRQAKMTTERKKAAPSQASGEDITQKIDQLISGDSIDSL